jgi:hypothetical protein
MIAAAVGTFFMPWLVWPHGEACMGEMLLSPRIAGTRVQQLFHTRAREFRRRDEFDRSV